MYIYIHVQHAIEDQRAGAAALEGIGDIYECIYIKIHIYTYIICIYMYNTQVKISVRVPPPSKETASKDATWIRDALASAAAEHAIGAAVGGSVDVSSGPVVMYMYVCMYVYLYLYIYLYI